MTCFIASGSSRLGLVAGTQPEVAIGRKLDCWVCKSLGCLIYLWMYLFSWDRSLLVLCVLVACKELHCFWGGYFTLRKASDVFCLILNNFILQMYWYLHMCVNEQFARGAGVGARASAAFLSRAWPSPNGVGQFFWNKAWVTMCPLLLSRAWGKTSPVWGLAFGTQTLQRVPTVSTVYLWNQSLGLIFPEQRL